MDYIERLITKLIGKETQVCPQGASLSTVSPSALALVLIAMISSGVWAFRTQAQGIESNNNANKAQPTYSELKSLLQEQQNNQLALVVEKNKLLSQRLDQHQQVQQQLSTNQGDLIRSVASLQSSINFMLQQMNPTAFAEVRNQASEVEQEQTAQVQRLMRFQTNVFLSMLNKKENPIKQDGSFYFISNPENTVSFIYKQKDDKILLVVDTVPHVTDISWTKAQEALDIRQDTSQ